MTFLHSIAGGIYDPLTDMWTATSTVNAPAPRTNHTAVWTGTKMIVWGGNGVNEQRFDGGIYDPTTDSWQPISTDNSQIGREGHAAVWVNGKMIIWGGGTSSGVDANSSTNRVIINSGEAYDPVENTWKPLTISSSPSPRLNFSAISTGSQMVIWGGNFVDSAANHILNTGGVYDPSKEVKEFFMYIKN